MQSTSHKSHRPPIGTAALTLGLLTLAACSGEEQEGQVAQSKSPASYTLPRALLATPPTLKAPIEGIPKGLGHIYHYPGGIRVPVLHVDIELFAPDPAALRTTLNLDPNKPGELVVDSSNPWADPANQGYFNCHAYALGETLGFTPKDLVNGAPVRTLGFPNPVAQLLPAFFELKHEFSGIDLSADTIESDTGLHNGDRILFVAETSDGPEYVHSGRVVKRGDENWVVSKLGEDPLALTPVATLFYLYSFDRVEIWTPR